MIENGQLAHGFPNSSFWSWNLSTLALDSFALAIVTTLLSSQAVALLFDVSLGIKQQNRINVADLHILHLVREASPLAIVANLFNNRILLRGRFRTACVPEESSRKEEDSLRKRTICKLLFLLILSPLLNIASVTLNVEKESSVTFSDAKFGGLSLGINEDLSIVEKHMPFTENC